MTLRNVGITTTVDAVKKGEPYVVRDSEALPAPFDGVHLRLDLGFNLILHKMTPDEAIDLAEELLGKAEEVLKMRSEN